MQEELEFGEAVVLLEAYLLSYSISYKRLVALVVF